MRVFVYGTLKDGYSNNYLLEQSRLIGEAVTPAEYTMHSVGAFPAVSEGGETAIVGEVWDVDGETFRRLDQLEGYPEFYDRRVINTTRGEAWMYYINDVSPYRAETIKTGVWGRNSHE